MHDNLLSRNTFPLLQVSELFSSHTQVDVAVSYGNSDSTNILRQPSKRLVT